MPAVRVAALIGLAFALPAWAWLPRGGAPADVPSAAVSTSSAALELPIRGMTISCPIYGEIWGAPAFSEALEEVKRLGVRWAAIHPYARIERDGEVRFTAPEATGYLGRALERARAADVKLFWKPHLAYWGRFEWRGTIGFGDDAAAWDRFFGTYRAFILAHARFAEAHGIPLLAVGTELERTVTHEARWRELIREVRAVYRGKLTWAANWDGVSRVPFWDALDLIGVQAYFPLRVDPRAELTDGLIRRAWERPLATLEGLARTHARPVLFTEIGYPDAPHAADEPWRSGRGEPDAPELRRRLVRVAAQAVEVAPFVAGMFWWKWMPGSPFGAGDFRMRAPAMQRALAEAWKTSPPKTSSGHAAPP